MSEFRKSILDRLDAIFHHVASNVKELPAETHEALEKLETLAGVKKDSVNPPNDKQINLPLETPTEAPAAEDPASEPAPTATDAASN